MNTRNFMIMCAGILFMALDGNAYRCPYLKLETLQTLHENPHGDQLDDRGAHKPVASENHTSPTYLTLDPKRARGHDMHALSGAIGQLKALDVRFAHNEKAVELHKKKQGPKPKAFELPKGYIITVESGTKEVALMGEAVAMSAEDMGREAYCEYTAAAGTFNLKVSAHLSLLPPEIKSRVMSNAAPAAAPSDMRGLAEASHEMDDIHRERQMKKGVILNMAKINGDDLKAHRMTPGSARETRLLTFLKRRQNIKSLTLKGYNHEVLMDALKSLPAGFKFEHLQSLSIPDGGLKTHHLLDLLPYITSRMPHLNSLALQGNRIGAAGAIAITKHLPHLTHLNLEYNQIGDDGAIAIAEHLRNLTTLDLAVNNISDTGAIAIGNNLKKLTDLTIAVNNIGDAGATVIAKYLPLLRALYSSDNQIGNAGAIAIAEHLPLLTELSLAANKIGGLGAIAIGKNLKRLASLSLSGNDEIGDAGAIAIAEHLRNLTLLELDDNKIGDPGAIAIANYLKKLTSLSLDINDIGDVGAIAIAEHLHHLTSLSLTANKIGDEGAIAIAKYLKKLTSLDLFKNNKIGDPGAVAIKSHLKHLRYIKL